MTFLLGTSFWGFILDEKAFFEIAGGVVDERRRCG